MKFSEKWLREWVEPEATTQELADRLTLCGLEVEAITPVAGEFTGVVVAAVREVKPHPGAGRLRVCTVDVGEAAPLTIVCGAANVRAGMHAPLARAGAVLPGGKRITRSALRGVESEGMLCSAVELGMAENSDGILELPGDAPLGADLCSYLGLDDNSVEINITPNRGDCLSILGVAREIGAQFGVALKERAARRIAPAITDMLPVNILAPAGCPRYAGRVISRLDPRAVAPTWMRERLRRSGLRSINAVVDVTNYVMLELGQPMHAFDRTKVIDGICVRPAEAGETIELLDGQTIELTPDTLVIADHRRAVALAGIMGGSATSVSQEGTTEIFLESAYFTPATIAGRARHFRLQTDSSHRFERGVDFELQVRAIERATELILAVCGGEAGPVVEKVSPAHLPGRGAITLRSRRVRRIIGVDDFNTSVAGILDRLGMTVEPHPEGWKVTPPSHRFDLTIEADLIEEVVRVVGYDRVPGTAPAGGIRLSRVPEGGIRPVARARQALVNRGYREAITYSFVDAAVNARFSPAEQSITLANPISQDMSVMRSTLWPGLVKAALYNQSRQQERVRLFEVGRIFRRNRGEIVQINKLGGIATGTSLPEQWGVQGRPVDVFDIKADVEAVLTLLNPTATATAAPADHPALHPGQSGALTVDGRTVSIHGALHPDFIMEYDLKSPVLVFEIDLDSAVSTKSPQYVPWSKFPYVRRDLSLTLDVAIPVAAVLDCIRKGAPPALRDLQLFDVYQGEGIDSGKKSIALGLIFQEVSSTLIDEVVDAVVADIVGRLASDLGGTLRE